MLENETKNPVACKNDYSVISCRITEKGFMLDKYKNYLEKSEDKEDYKMRKKVVKKEFPPLLKDFGSLYKSWDAMQRWLKRKNEV